MVSREDIIEDVQRVQAEVEGTMTLSDYRQHGSYSTGPLYSKFDGLGEVREKAGIDDSDIQSGTAIPEDKLLDAIHALRDELGQVPKREEMEEEGSYSAVPYRRAFGTWGDAVIEAGYEPHRPNKYNVEKRLFTCEFCGTQREERVSQNNNQENWFCTESCKNEWQAENVVGEGHHQYDRVSTECDWCGDPKEVKPSVFEKKDHHFCNYDCMGKWRTVRFTGELHPRYEDGKVELICEVCGDPYPTGPAEAESSRFCSYECMGKQRSEEWTREGNPNWKPETEGYDRIPYGPNYDSQRQKRLEVDDYECVICGMGRSEHFDEYGGADLSMHHVIPRVNFIKDGEYDYEAANELSNLRTMCKSHHQMWEDIPIAPE